MDMTLLYRKAVLSVARSKWVTNFAVKRGMQLGAARFVAGESLEAALQTAKKLNEKGILVTMDQLGEGVHEEKVAREMCQAYMNLMEGVTRAGVTKNVSLKPTQMGLSFDRKLAEENITAIVKRAKELGCFVRIDMEDTPYTDTTLEIYYNLRKQGYDNVGTVIQSYLYRTDRDIEELKKVDANLRIVKGAYKEPPEHAYPSKKDTDAAFIRVCASLLQAGKYTALATHDDNIIHWMKQFAATENISRDLFEFQMLYGVRTALQEQLVKEGYKVRCYVPFGRMWWPYFSRRIAERPGNLWFVVKNMIKG